MKKARIVVGTGVLVMAVALGSGFAQQVSPKSTVPDSAVSLPKPGDPAELAEDKAPIPKAAAPAAGEVGKSTTPAGMNPVEKGTATKAMEPAKTDKPTPDSKSVDKPAADKPEAPVSADKTRKSTPDTAKDAGQGIVEKKSPVKPDESPAAGRQMMEKASDVKETVKPAATP